MAWNFHLVNTVLCKYDLNITSPNAFHFILAQQLIDTCTVYCNYFLLLAQRLEPVIYQLSIIFTGPSPKLQVAMGYVVLSQEHNSA